MTDANVRNAAGKMPAGMEYSEEFTPDRGVALNSGRMLSDHRQGAEQATRRAEETCSETTRELQLMVAELQRLNAELRQSNAELHAANEELEAMNAVLSEVNETLLRQMSNPAWDPKED